MCLHFVSSSFHVEWLMFRCFVNELLRRLLQIAEADAVLIINPGLNILSLCLFGDTNTFLWCMTLRIPPGGIKCSTGNDDIYIRFGVGHCLTLSLSVRRHFPGCIGLQYVLSDGSFEVLRVEGGKVYPPPDGWGPEDRIYMMIFAKGRPPWTVKQMIERKFRVDGTSLDMITEDGLISIPQIHVGDSVTSASCSICLEEFEIQASAYILPCSHIFHKQCLGDWIVINQSCPYCRFDLRASLQQPE